MPLFPVNDGSEFVTSPSPNPNKKRSFPPLRLNTISRVHTESRSSPLSPNSNLVSSFFKVFLSDSSKRNSNFSNLYPSLSPVGSFKLAEMSRGPSSLKRKQPDSRSPLDSMAEQERIIYNLIRSKQGIGIWLGDLKKELNIPDNVAKKFLKSLEAKKLIKLVANVHSRIKKHYLAAEFEPSAEITGGAWYADGKLDTGFINILKGCCLKVIHKQRVATLDGISDAIRRSGLLTVDYTTQQIEEIVKTLVLDNEIVEVESNGMGEFDSIPVGKVCYKCTNKGSRGDLITGAMASIPCGVCQRISDCTPDGIISPKTCRYYTEWLNF